MHLHKKVVVITDASDGIGKAIALRLARDGMRIALVARNQERLQEVEVACKSLGADMVRFYKCDLSQRSQMKSTVENIVADFSGIDVLINNAGVWQKLAQLDEIEDDVIDEIIDTNLKGVIYMTKYALPSLRMQDEGIILNISSKSGVVAQDGQAAYTASKYGVRGFTEVLNKDLADTSIRVGGIYQAGTNTAMFAKADQDFPVNTFSEPSDLADVVATMLSLPQKIWLHDVRVEK